MSFLIGQGFDIHKKSTDKGTLKLGGISFENERFLVGHSDGDCVVHALIDAILGATCQGDIGDWFSDKDSAYHDADSIFLLREVLNQIKDSYVIVNADLTIFLESPRLGANKKVISNYLSGILGAPVNVKAKTFEGLGIIGEDLAVASQAIVLVKMAASDD